MTADEVNAALAQIQDALKQSVAALEGAQAEMDAAVLAERARCARIAETTADVLAAAVTYGESDTSVVRLRNVAARIRSGE
jgi:hypothetical protein